MNKIAAGVVVGVCVAVLSGGLYLGAREGKTALVSPTPEEKGPSQPADTSGPPPPLAPSAVESAAAPPGRLMVEVQGAVVSPGVYSLSTDARVFDAIKKAGGSLESAEIRDLNIAAFLVDGSVLSVPFRASGKGGALPGAADLNPPSYTRSGWSEAASQSAGTVTGVSGSQSVQSRININTATQAELETLPGVGVKTAEKIISFRQTQPFTQVDDLRYVQGIGEKRMETLRPHVTVE